MLSSILPRTVPVSRHRASSCRLVRSATAQWSPWRTPLAPNLQRCSFPTFSQPSATVKRTLHTSSRRYNGSTSLNNAASETQSSHDGCGSPSCCASQAAESTAATPVASESDASHASSSPSSSFSNDGCGSPSCACASPPPIDPAELAAASEELSSLQSAVSHHYKLGEMIEALEVAERAASLALQFLGRDHPAYASTLNNLALLHKTHHQDFERAAKLYEEALGIYERSVGKDHPSYRTCLTNLGLAYRSLGQLQRAREHLSEVVGTLSTILSPTAARASLPLASALLHLGGVVCQQDEHEAAIELQQRALKIILRKCGEESSEAATALNDLAYTFKQMGQHQRALPLYEKSLAIRARNLPPRHPSTIISYNNLAELLRAMGEEEKALGVQRRLLQVMGVDPDESDEMEEASEADDHHDATAAGHSDSQDRPAADSTRKG